jgi:hypothetical protein
MLITLKLVTRIMLQYLPTEIDSFCLGHVRLVFYSSLLAGEDAAW